MFGFTVLLIVVAVLFSLASFVASMWLVVIAFRRSALWGLGVLFVPFVALVYAIKFWHEAKKPFLIGIGAGVASGIFFMATVGVGAAAMSKRVGAEMKAAAAKQIAAETARVSSGTVAPRGEARETPRDLDASAPLRAAPSARQPDAESEVEAARAREIELLLRKRAKLSATKHSPPPYDAENVSGDGYAPLALKDSAWAVGRQVKVVARDGQTHRGELVHAGANGLELQKFVGAGTVNIEFGHAEVDALYVKTDPIVTEH